MSPAPALCALLLLGQLSAPAPLEEAPPPPPQPVARVFGTVRGLLGVSTHFDPPPPDAAPENVLDLRGRANLGVDVKLSDSVRVLVEGRGLWRGVAQQGFAHARADFEPQLGEAFVDLYTRRFDLRVGSQVVTLGANPAFAPADAFNPRDLRESFLQGEPEDVRIPVLAARAQGELSGFGWLVAYAPFFTPDRYTVFGQNESLLQPGWGAGVPPYVDPSIEDALQPHLLETKRPRAFPWLGDLALRVTAPELAGVRLGASWVWVNERLPEVRADPELRALLGENARGAPLDPALLLSVENRVRAGEALYSGTYARQHLFSLEASRVVGPAQVDLDVTFSPAQSFYTDTFASVRKRSVTWVLGITQAEDSPWLYNLSYLGMAVPGVEASELLALIEPSTARGTARTAWLHVLVGSVSRRLWGDRLEVGARAAFEPIQRSGALGPRVAYRARERVTLLLAGEFFLGSHYSPFGYFQRIHQVLLGIQADLF